MERIEALLVPGVNQLTNGVVATVKLNRPYEGVETSDTSDHEAAHALPMVIRGRFLRLASRIANLAKGYLGRTEGEIDAVSAMGPDALGHSGTGWDKKVAGRLVKDIGTAASVAKEIIYSNWAAFRVLARGVEVEGEISGYRANVLIEQNKNPDALVLVNGPFGSRSFVAQTREADGHIIPFAIPESAENYKQN